MDHNKLWKVLKDMEIPDRLTCLLRNLYVKQQLELDMEQQFQIGKGTYNPYLEDYYKDIQRWSYNLETYFLAQRFQDLLEISKSEEVIIQDRTILEGVHIFVANNKAMGNLSDRDFDTYMQLFNLMMSMVHEPDLLIYLKSSVPTLVSQIQKRGREYEKSISIEYLSNLNDRYDEWIGNYKGKVLVIEADDLDFEHRPEDFAAITDKIDAQLYGLF